MDSGARTAPVERRPREVDHPTAYPPGPRSLGDRVRLPAHQLRRALREPRRLRRLHYSAVLASLHSLVEDDVSGFLRRHFATSADALRDLEAALLGDTGFRRRIEERHLRVRGDEIRLFGASAAEDYDRSHRVLYLALRLARPDVVVETGVFDGFSSAMMLKALADNGRGRLCSIDRPARRRVAASTNKMFHDALPAGHEPGWVVPDELRGRWSLRLGTSADLLAPWLRELGTIDVFFHDSLHTSDNMTREFEGAWSALADGGCLISDDVFWNRAFWKFCSARRRPAAVFRGLGLLRKYGAADRTSEAVAAAEEAPC